VARALRETDVVSRLRAACKEAGGQARWASAAGVTPQYVSDVLLGRRAPGDAVVRPLGLERDVRYVARRPVEVAIYDEHGVTLLTAEML
jgi:DNA-binding transcriptional regulator YdaS (Cro superfamily)